MGTPGPLELIIIFAVVLLLFGAKRIPEIARGIGKGIREFKDATSEISRELEAESQQGQINEPQTPRQGTPQSRQRQRQGQPQQQSQPQPEAQPQQASPESASADTSGDEVETQKSEAQESDAQDAKETS